MAKESSFGAYLTRLRLKGGFDRTSDYLRALGTIPFTENYYRDVEAGRKVLSIDAVVELEKCLKLSSSDRIDFFWHYFRDLMPAPLHEELFGKRGASAPGTLKDINKLREYDATIYRRALSLSRYEQEFVATEEITASFMANVDLLPLMTYLYMVESASEAELKAVASNIGVRFDDRAKQFVELVGTVAGSGAERRYRRFAPVLRMPRNPDALALKDVFLRYEMERSIGKAESEAFFAPDETFRYSSMVTLRGASLERLQERIVDLMAELDVASKSGRQLEDKDAAPYFFSLVVSGRPEYDGRPARSSKRRAPKRS